MTRALHVPVWLQLLTVTLTATGHWRAGSGRRTGWLLAAVVHATWAGFAVWSGPAVEAIRRFHRGGTG